MESCEFNPHTFPPQYSDSIEYEEKKVGDGFKKSEKLVANLK